MNKKNFSTQDVLAISEMNQVRGGGMLADMYTAYTGAKGTPATTSTTIAKPTSVRGDERVAQTTSTISTVGTQLGATAQDIYVATSVAIAALPYIK